MEGIASDKEATPLFQSSQAISCTTFYENCSDALRIYVVEVTVHDNRHLSAADLFFSIHGCNNNVLFISPF